MPSTLENRHRIRRSFGSLTAPIQVPHLLKIQLDSFERFLQRDVPPDQREDKGLEAVFRSVFLFLILVAPLLWNMSITVWVILNILLKNAGSVE